MPEVPDQRPAGGLRVEPRLEITALPGIPRVCQGDDLAELTLRGLERVEIQPCAGDVLVCTSKLLSRAEGRWQDVSRVRPSERARELAVRVGKDPEVVELILRESRLLLYGFHLLLDLIQNRGNLGMFGIGIIRKFGRETA